MLRSIWFCSLLFLVSAVAATSRVPCDGATKKILGSSGSDLQSAAGDASSVVSELQQGQQQQQQQELLRPLQKHHNPAVGSNRGGPATKRSLLQLGPLGQFSPLLTPLDVIVYGGWDTLAKSTVMGAATGGLGLSALSNLVQGGSGAIARGFNGGQRSSTTSGSSSAQSSTSRDDSSGSSTRGSEPITDTTRSVLNQAASLPGPAGAVGRAAPALVDPALSAARPALQGVAGPAAPALGALSTALQPAALESGSLPGLQGGTGLQVDAHLHSSNPLLTVLQSALASSSADPSSDVLSAVQAALAGSSSYDSPMSSSVLTGLQQLAAAASKPAVSAAQQSVLRNSDLTNPTGSNPLLSALQTVLAGSSGGIQGYGAMNPVLAALQQGMLGGSSSSAAIPGSSPWQSLVQSALAASNTPQPPTAGSSAWLPALLKVLGTGSSASQPAGSSTVTSTFGGRQHVPRGRSLRKLASASSLQAAEASSDGSSWTSGDSSSWSADSANYVMTDQMLPEQGHLQMLHRLQQLPHYQQQPWQHHAMQMVGQNIQHNIPQTKQTVHDMHNMVQSVKQTAVETKQDAIYNGARAAIEAKRVDNKVKGQLVDSVKDSLNRLQPVVKQTVDWKGIAQPWANAAQDVMKAKSKYVKDFADDVADTDIDVGAELDVVLGSAANLTRNPVMNLTGMSNNLAGYFSGGAINFLNETRGATSSFVSAIPSLVDTTTQTALNGITSLSPAIFHAFNTTQQVVNTVTKFPREIGGDAGKLVSAGVGAAPLLAASIGTGVASVVPTVVPWVTHGVNLATSAGLGAVKATGTVMHNTVVPMATGALQASGSLGTNLLTKGFNQGFNEGLLASLERRKPYQNGPLEAARVSDQPAMFLPSSFAPMGQMMTVTYPCPTGVLQGPAGPVPGVPGQPIPPPPVPGQPPQVPGLLGGGPPTAPIGTFIGPGIPCGVPLYMVPKHVVPKQRPRPQPLVEFPVDPPVPQAAAAPAASPNPGTNVPTVPLPPGGGPPGTPGIVAPIVRPDQPGTPGAPGAPGITPPGVTPPGVTPPGVTPPGVIPPGTPAPGTTGPTGPGVLPPIRIPSPAPGVPPGVPPPGVTPPGVTPPGVTPPGVPPGAVPSAPIVRPPGAPTTQSLNSVPQQGSGLVDVRGPFPNTAAAVGQGQSAGWFGRRRLAGRLPGPSVTSVTNSTDTRVREPQDGAKEQASITSSGPAAAAAARPKVQVVMAQQPTAGQQTPVPYSQPVAEQHELVLLQAQQVGRA